jgi:hypothetical protein
MDNNIITAGEKSTRKRKWNFRITRMGKLADVTSMNFKPTPHIKIVSQKQRLYMIGRWKNGKFYSVGEVREMQNKDGRNKRSLRHIFRKMRQTIQAEFGDLDDKKLFVTLTYAENMQDEKQLKIDFDAFMKRLKRHLSGHRLEYIVIIEPQQRGAWHAHLLLKSDQSLFIHYADMERLWGHGMTRTERLSGIDNIGAYFIAYMSNIPLDEEMINAMELTDDDIETRGADKSKRYIKGERLKYYPDYMQIWRHSRGIKTPESMKIGKQKLLFDYEKPYLRHEYQLSDDEQPLKIISSQHKKK